MTRKHIILGTLEICLEGKVECSVEVCQGIYKGSIQFVHINKVFLCIYL